MRKCEKCGSDGKMRRLALHPFVYGTFINQPVMEIRSIYFFFFFFLFKCVLRPFSLTTLTVFLTSVFAITLDFLLQKFGSQ